MIKVENEKTIIKGDVKEITVDILNLCVGLTEMIKTNPSIIQILIECDKEFKTISMFLETLTDIVKKENEKR